MPKKYKLITPCAEYPIGTEARQENSNRGYYEIWLPDGDAWDNVVRPIQVEGNPVWQLIPEEPEKKIVERWRGDYHEEYYTIGDGCYDEVGDLEDKEYYADGDYFQTPEARNRARKRVEIMCRLMGLAETIEEGSTEMRGKFIIFCDDGVLKVSWSGLSQCHSDLATFTTRALAQLFLDSAGQDALDWYGEVGVV